MKMIIMRLKVLKQSMVSLQYLIVQCKSLVFVAFVLGFSYKVLSYY